MAEKYEAHHRTGHVRISKSDKSRGRGSKQPELPPCTCMPPDSYSDQFIHESKWTFLTDVMKFPPVIPITVLFFAFPSPASSCCCRFSFTSPVICPANYSAVTAVFQTPASPDLSFHLYTCTCPLCYYPLSKYTSTVAVVNCQVVLILIQSVLSSLFTSRVLT